MLAKSATGSWMQVTGDVVIRADCLDEALS